MKRVFRLTDYTGRNCRWSRRLNTEGTGKGSRDGGNLRWGLGGLKNAESIGDKALIKKKKRHTKSPDGQTNIDIIYSGLAEIYTICYWAKMERSSSNCVCSDRCIRLCKEQNAVLHFRIVSFPSPIVAHGDVTESCEKCVEHWTLKLKEVGGSPAAFVVYLEPLPLTLDTEVSVVQ